MISVHRKQHIRAKTAPTNYPTVSSGFTDCQIESTSFHLIIKIKSIHINPLHQSPIKLHANISLLIGLQGTMIRGEVERVAAAADSNDVPISDARCRNTGDADEEAAQGGDDKDEKENEGEAPETEDLSVMALAADGSRRSSR
eukprot:scaffold36676_cov240-Skeletonema_marinoi.AAC.4